MTNIETYLQYRDISGISSTIGEFEAALAALDIGIVLRIFAAINILCSRRGLPHNKSTQMGLVQQLFDAKLAYQIGLHGKDLFHRKQCLFVLREAMRLSPDIPGMELTPEVRHKIGVLCLMANDHASSTTPAGPSEIDVWLAHMCDFIPAAEANELKFDLASIPRMHEIVNDLAPARLNDSGLLRRCGRIWGGQWLAAQDI
jgi:hypothetical protein